MKNELKKFIQCPKCNKGYVTHVGDHYYCSSSNDVCNFMIPSNLYDAKITKSLMVSLINKGFLEPMFIGLKVFKNKPEVNGFITLSKEANLEFKFPNNFPISKCPKCKKENVYQKYSENKESIYYGCKNYKSCGFYLPFMYRNKPLWIKDIIKLCEFKRISKQYLSKEEKKYTLDIFLNPHDFKIKTSMDK